MTKSYDQSCHDLAASFLSDEPDINTPENRHELAQDIQSAIEDFIADKKDEWNEANSQFGVGA